MLAILLTILGMCATPPPEIPQPIEEQTVAVRAFDEQKPEEGKEESKNFIIKDNSTKDIKGENQNEIIKNPDRRPIIYPMPNPSTQGKEQDSSRPDYGETVIPEIGNEADRGGSRERQGASEERYYRIKSRVDGDYKRMQELRESIASSLMDVERDMTEYLALKRQYVSELRSALKDWNKDRERQTEHIENKD